MAYLVVPDIKDERVVCQTPCEHTDCARIRKEWTGARCARCGRELKVGDGFYYISQEIDKHICRSCMEDRLPLGKTIVTDEDGEL